jgi:hypothetical protein
VGIREKVSAIHFETETGLSPEQIREAGRRSMEAGRRFMNSTISETGGAAEIQGYVIKGPGGLKQQLAMTVSWEEIGQGRRRVSFEVGDFMTSQQTIMFIPIAPKTAPGLTSARRFAEALREELSAA